MQYKYHNHKHHLYRKKKKKNTAKLGMVDIFWGFQWIFFYYSFDHFAERTGIDDEDKKNVQQKENHRTENIWAIKSPHCYFFLKNNF